MFDVNSHDDFATSFLKGCLLLAIIIFLLGIGVGYIIWG